MKAGETTLQEQTQSSTSASAGASAGTTAGTEALTRDQIERLRSLGAATVYEAQGAKGALDCGIKPIDPGSRLVGPALTVDTRPADNLMLHYALLKARRGDVLVVDAKGFLGGRPAPGATLLTAAAMKAGIAGLVIHGAVRDSNQIVEAGFAVFCRRSLSIKEHRPSMASPASPGTCRCASATR